MKRDGSIIWLQTQTTIISWNGEPAVQTMVVDITARKSREDRLHHQANYDPLTDLPSRKLALDRLDSAIVNARRRVITWPPCSSMSTASKPSTMRSVTPAATGFSGN